MDSSIIKAEIITIGDELLIGQVVDTNSAWMASELNNIGVEVVQITSISDEKESIIKTLADATTRADIVLMTGGLGPTKDDITKAALCDYFHTTLRFDPVALENVTRLFCSRGMEVTERNRKQAEVPANCTPVKNDIGTAPGMWFEDKGRIIVSMPGVPFEMKHMMSHYILPKVIQLQHDGIIIHKTIITQGIGESALCDMLTGWEETLPRHIHLAYLPQPGVIRLRLTAKGSNRERLSRDITEQVEKLKTIIPDYIFGYDDDTLEKIIGRILKEKKLTLSTAESCTGGYIAHLITSVPGSSDYYTGSVIAYSNVIKKKILGVSQKLLVRHGAVSEEVVTSMAVGVKKKFHTDFAIATSGIAGPDGGTPDKPVGTVWIAVATPDRVIAQRFRFGQHRESNIKRTAAAGLNLLRSLIRF
ncbi:MAG: competence/damage-inducible protein A [Bacteroidetes bacterium]|nr:competence/damage-inducible protein A [Bacteroidota bacterium]